MKRTMKMKRILCLLGALMMMLSCITFTASAGTATDAKNSVVAVINEDFSGMGSGFAIGEVGKPVEYIVTNWHVVLGTDANGNYNDFKTATVAFDAASNDLVTANIYFHDESKDIAVLKLPQPTDKRDAMVLCPTKYVDLDDSFAALGYPGNQDSDWRKYNKDDITVTKGGIKKVDRYEGLDVYLLDLAITFGNSGGPLVNSKGEVVGINRGFNGENYALAIDELLTVLDRDRIPVTVHGETNWLLIACAGAVLIIIVLLVILLVRKNKKQAAVRATQAYANVTEATQPRQQAQAPNANAQPTGARVVAIGGTLNGRRYNVTGAVKIGRDASQCAIAFPVNTQGVGRVHCEIAYNGSVCYVKDLNSSYGTFTPDGRKLAPNTPHVLNSGDKFYLASPENTFEVRF